MGTHEKCAGDWHAPGTAPHCPRCAELWPCRAWLLAENDRLGTELADTASRVVELDGLLAQAVTELTRAEEDLAEARYTLTTAGYDATGARDE